MTPRLPTKSRPPEPERNFGTYLALVFLVAVSLGLLSLVSLVLPQVRGLILVIGGFCGMISLHYFTWGRWLSRIASEQRESEDKGQADEIRE